MEIFEFKDTFCVSLFKESKYNTSLKPNLLANVFQNSVSIKCSFKTNDFNKEQWIFSKQGIVNSGVFIKEGLIYFILTTTNNNTDFSNSVVSLSFEINNTDFEIEYSIDIDNSTLIVKYNGETKKAVYTGNVSDYSNVPLWIGTSNPFAETKNYFNGIISEFILSNNEGIITDLDFSNVNRFKVWDKSGNGNYAYIEEFGNKKIQIILNKMIAGNSLEVKDIKNVNKTLI